MVISQDSGVWCMVWPAKSEKMQQKQNPANFPNPGLCHELPRGNIGHGSTPREPAVKRIVSVEHLRPGQAWGQGRWSGGVEENPSKPSIKAPGRGVISSAEGIRGTLSGCFGLELSLI